MAYNGLRQKFLIRVLLSKEDDFLNRASLVGFFLSEFFTLSKTSFFRVDVLFGELISKTCVFREKEQWNEVERE